MSTVSDPADGVVLRESFKPDKDDFVVVVMGLTGSGKSNFINNVTGNPEPSEASNLAPDTQSVTPYPVSFDNYRLVFVDTPGFDHIKLTDNEVVKVIADWLAQKYPGGTRVVGMIYLHRITDGRMIGSTYKNLQMFARSCGDVPMRRARLVTTMWDQVEDQQLATQKENQLKNDIWKLLIDGGAEVHRFCNSSDSARGIIDTLLREGKGDLREELIEQRRRLDDAEAGKVLHNRLQTVLVEYRSALEELSEEAKLQNNLVLVKSLQEEEDRIDARLCKTFEEAKEMKIPLSTRILLWLFGWKARTDAVPA